jgi:hypothetical protein
MDTARALVKEGRDAREKGDQRGALEKFKQAHALGRTPVTGIELARSHKALGEMVEAREVCVSIERLPVASDETQRSADARTEAATCAEAMKAELGELRLALKVVQESGALHEDQSTAAITVTVDGATVPQAALGAARKVNPGAHKVVASFEGAPPVSVEVTVQKGEKKDARLSVLRPKALKIVQRDAAGALVVAPEKPGLSPLVPIGLVTAGVGLVVMGIGGITALGKQSEIESKCQRGANRCDPLYDLKSAKSDAITLATISTVGLGVALIGGIVTLAGFLANSSSTKTETKPSAKRTLNVTPLAAWGTF